MALPDLIVNDRLTLPRRCVRESFTQAGGAGGQNVNKRATAVHLEVAADDLALLLPADALARLRVIAGAAWVGEAPDERLHLRAHTARTQAANRALAEERLLALLRMALVRPRTRRKTTPSRGVKERRLSDKRHVAARKSARGKKGE